MHVSEWFPADAITLRTSVEIIGSVLLNRPYRDAPVSNLSMTAVRKTSRLRSPKVRTLTVVIMCAFGECLKAASKVGQFGLGSATFDRGVGLSRYTGQITHHIAPMSMLTVIC